LNRYDKVFLEKISEFPVEYNCKILAELQTRLKKLSDYKELTHFLYNDIKSIEIDMYLNPKMKIESVVDVKKALKVSLDVLNNTDIDLESPESIKETFIMKIKEAEMKNGQVLWPVRVALSAENFSP